MKKWILGIILVGVGALMLYIYLTSQSHGTESKELSERSKEFLKKQSSKGNLEFGGVDSENKRDTNVSSSQDINVDKCFSLNIPFAVEQNRSMGKCFNQIMTISPRAMVNVYIREVSFSSVDSDPGVVMRRHESKTYKEEKVNAGGKQFVVFKKIDAGYEKSAMYQNASKQFNLTLVSSISDDSFDSKFTKMLESVVIK